MEIKLNCVLRAGKDKKGEPVVRQPGEIVEVEDEQARRLIERGQASDPSDDPVVDDPVDAEERIAAIQSAIENLDTDNEALWNKDGTPKVGAIREATGLQDVSAEELKAAIAAIE